MGGGLWCGLLSTGQCLLELDGSSDAMGHSGDLLLGPGPMTLRPVSPCHLLALPLTGTVADAFLAGLSACENPLPRFANSAACPGAAELLARLCDGSRRALEASQIAYALLCELSHADEAVPSLSPLVAEAVQAIRDNYMGLYGVEELSEELGVSKCHLIRVFSAEMGVSPGHYLIRTRLEAVKLLLIEREYSLDVIANLCGFSCANYLCRVFKKELGVTPAVWRESAAPRPDASLIRRQDAMYV